MYPQPAPPLISSFVELTTAAICPVCMNTPAGRAIVEPAGEGTGEGVELGIGVEDICHTCVAVTLVLTVPVPVTSTFSPRNGAGPLMIVLDVV